MVEIVVPLGIQAVAAGFRGIDHPHVVQIAFGDNVDPPPECLALPVDSLGQFLKNMPGAEVVDAVDGVEPQGVNMVFALASTGHWR